MKCYKCNATLAPNKGKCPQCGADVAVYRKAAKASNAYYNLGLAKAKVRDLTGAAESLKISVMINKNNIEARNLLGLVYCEMGEVVEALSQWVISKNLQPDNNPAGSYIAQIQSSQGKFDAITATVKKYNQSLKYAKEGNLDVATIQLKKVVAQNPHLIKAQQLLALIYIKDGEYARAKKLLLSVLKTDKNNTLAQLYLKEIEEIQQLKKKQNARSSEFLPQKREKKEYNTAENKPLSGNDVILPRSSYKEPGNGAITIINILVGVVIGAALIWFLVMPSRYKGITADYNKSIQEYSEQLSSGNVELNSLTKQLEDIKSEKEALEERLAGLSGEGGSNKLLTAVIGAANSYIANDNVTAAKSLMDIDVSELPSDEAKKLYNTLAEATMKPAANEFYTQATTAYNKADYSTAAVTFANAYKCDSTKVEAAYYAAKSYVALNQTEDAKKYYQYIVDDFRSSGYYSEANEYVTSH